LFFLTNGTELLFVFSSEALLEAEIGDRGYEEVREGMVGGTLDMRQRAPGELMVCGERWLSR